MIIISHGGEVIPGLIVTPWLHAGGRQAKLRDVLIAARGAASLLPQGEEPLGIRTGRLQNRPGRGCEE
jgi:hypothetical protein